MNTADWIARKERERRATKKRKEPVTFLLFDSDAQIAKERVDTRTVYRLPSGVIEINWMGSRHQVLDAGDRLLFRSGQEAPIRRSARVEVQRLALLGRARRAAVQAGLGGVTADAVAQAVVDRSHTNELLLRQPLTGSALVMLARIIAEEVERHAHP